MAGPPVYVIHITSSQVLDRQGFEKIYEVKKSIGFV
jgi:hypothetical protein